MTGATRNNQKKRPGRPAGPSETRDLILKRARELFAQQGIDKTSIRSIAAAAGVDSALVHHYFGTKQQLFTAAIDIPIDPMATILIPLRATPIEDLGHALPALLLPLWDSEMGDGLLATMRSLLSGSDVILIRAFLQEVIAAEIAPRIDNPSGTGRLRVQLVASQLIGIVMARYIIKLEPFASLRPEQITDAVAPTIQRYLTGELPNLA